jgi:uncharacterized membrane protein YfcA
MDLPIWLYAAFFGIAAIYSLFGFGGGSSYLAALVLAGFSYLVIPPVALTCNLIVATTSFYHYARAGHFRFQKVLPFIILSIPMAYLGGSLPISKQLFSLLLGLSLLFVAFRMFLADEIQTSVPSPKRHWLFGVSAGGAIGFLSGLLGIGGGIFLSPLLLLIRWANAKEAAAAASFFIIVNSVAELLARVHKMPFDVTTLLYLSLAVFAGGQFGARLGAYHVPRLTLQRLLAVFVLYASIKLLGIAL